MAGYTRCRRCGQWHHLLPRNATPLDRRQRCINTLMDNLEYWREETARLLIGERMVMSDVEQGKLVQWYWRLQKRLTTKETWVPPTQEQRRIKP